MTMEINRRAFVASLGGAAAIKLMDHEQRADALEDYSMAQIGRASCRERVYVLV